ncbi:putative quinol monooxygenase [Aurantimonas sp. Leaf443]|uniref:putative quinol monooxygenase n=1 Tax=Aurantimonas sp. Leaf443 TaxID=1736378 RepID=UPI0006FC83E1|nr:putative quinol monooxygenase [Aurantimonas sp. Leaf443]KQT82217.1 hypothetical protein ASG48_16420 [Aurantimonas sp. Leaf443]
MIVVSGTIRFSPAALETLREKARVVLTETAKEAGCIVYSFGEDFLEPGLVRVYEEWESRAHLDAHVKSPHTVDWNRSADAVGYLARDINVLEIGSVTPLD